jgi:hypothetical protein
MVAIVADRGLVVGLAVGLAPENFAPGGASVPL